MPSSMAAVVLGGNFNDRCSEMCLRTAIRGGTAFSGHSSCMSGLQIAHRHSDQFGPHAFDRNRREADPGVPGKSIADCRPVSMRPTIWRSTAPGRKERRVFEMRRRNRNSEYARAEPGVRLGVASSPHSTGRRVSVERFAHAVLLGECRRRTRSTGAGLASASPCRILAATSVAHRNAGF